MKLKDIILAMITGIGIGMPITIVCMIALGGFNGVLKEFLVWLVASALFGVVSVFTFKFSDKLSIPLSTALHCVGCLGITMGACAINGYFENFKDVVFAILPVFLVVYAVIYAITLIGAKREAKKINESLKGK